MPTHGPFFTAAPRVKIPPEFAAETAFLAFLGVTPRELRNIRYYRRRMYKHFSIAKGSDKARVISAPDARLKHLQRKIAEKLGPIYRPRRPVHGFVLDRSVKTNALSHLHRRYVLNIDLKDFFPSVTQNRVEGLLRALGVHPRVADTVGYICTINGHLPQGAPSSPLISNMLCFRLDRQLMAVAKETRCIYTRYADDITFSSHQPQTMLFEAAPPSAGHFDPQLLTSKIRDAISSNGFAINPDKVHYADRHSRRTVTGLKVNELLNVDRRYVRNLRAAIFSVEKLGVAAAERKYKDKHGGSSTLTAHLRGKIAFLTHIKGKTDPVVRGLTLRFNACFASEPIEVTPTSTELRDRSVWILDNDAAIEQGTAFFLKDVGLVTAAHCVEQAAEVEIHHPTKPANKFKARVLKTCTHRDLALLEHDIPSTEYFELEHGAAAAAQGDHLAAVGYPGYAPGDSINVRGGTVSALKVSSLVHFIEVTQTLTPGMSGGPLLDAANRVVGIIHRGGPGEGRNLAVNISMLDVWLHEGCS